jgi:hypothetical protein
MKHLIFMIFMTAFVSYLLRHCRNMLLLGASLSCGSLASGTTMPARPNIVVILTDDLSRDPSQRHNRFAAEPELVQELRAFVRQLETAGRHAPLPPR